MAGRGQVSWLPGIGRPHLPGSSVSPPVADANAPAASFAPVTVAGPRRLLTGLPLTTDRIYAGESTPGRGLRSLLPSAVGSSPTDIPGKRARFSLTRFAIAHPLRRRILRKLGDRDEPASPTQLAGELEGPLGKVAYHVRVLWRLGAISAKKEDEGEE